MKYRIVLVVLLCILGFTGCSKTESLQSRNVFAMDTYMELKAYTDDENILAKAEEEIHKIDDRLNRNNQSGQIYKINNNTQYSVDSDTANLINTALDICSSTKGCFDITIAPVMDIWGFYGQEYNVPTKEQIDSALKKVDYTKIKVDNNTVYNQDNLHIDLGGIAKGYTSDRVMDIFAKNGVDSGIISLGGNVQAIGKKKDGSSWSVAIQNPFDDSSYIGVLQIEDKAVVTSGGYQRFFIENGKTYHHIIDPSTGYPADNGLASVSIVCDSGTLADGLSTSLFVMGLDKAKDYWKNNQKFEAVFVTNKNEIYITKGLENSFSSDYKYNIIE